MYFPSGGWPPAALDSCRRVLFLDRDGVINVDHGYVHRPDQTEWVPGIFDLAMAARNARYDIVVVTNQAGIARGYYTEAQFLEYTQWLHRQFEARGVPLLATYYCPHHPRAALSQYRLACDCRKPNPGMLLTAISDLRLDPATCLLMGDMPTDVQAAKAAGIVKAWLVGELPAAPFVLT